MRRNKLKDATLVCNMDKELEELEKKLADAADSDKVDIQKEIDAHRKKIASTRKIINVLRDLSRESFINIIHSSYVFIINYTI